MPEGDTVFRAAKALHRALAGHTVTRFDSVYPAVIRVAEDHPIIGRTVESVSARGKHLLIAFSGDLVLRTHMRMNGSWHLYRIGARWQRPARDMRVLVGTADAVAVGFNVPIAELLSSRDLARHKELRALGPDLLAGAGSLDRLGQDCGGPEQRRAKAEGLRDEKAFNRSEVIRRMRARGRDAIADVLLNQRVVAGIGNVFKSEILFLAGIEPFTPVAMLTDDHLARLVDISRDQLAANVLDRSKTLSLATGRRTTRSLDPNATLWVYGRGGKPCRRCGTIVQSKKTGLHARLTYWCPQCQVRRAPL
jgi:endonuclease-8